MIQLPTAQQAGHFFRFYTKVIALQLSLAFVIFGLVIPPRAYADPPGRKPQVSPSELFPSGDDLVAKQQKRDAVIGVSSERAARDPYYMEGQKIAVEEWRMLKNGDTPGDGEYLEEEWTDSEHSSVIRYAVARHAYSFDEPNADYTGPGRYNLSRVTFQITPDQKLVAQLEVPTRKGKRIFKHYFDIPGVQSVSRNTQFATVLLRNGDVRNLLGAHIGLFEANELAGGAPMLFPLVHVVPSASPDQPIDPNLELVTYDARTPGVVFPEELESIKDLLRYADEVIVKRVGDRLEVRDVLPLASVAGALDGHLGLLGIREKFLTTAPTMEGMLDAIQQGLLLSNQPEVQHLLPANPGSGPFFSMMGQRPLARGFRRTQEPWSKGPFELPDFSSEGLADYTKFVQAVSRLADEKATRSTYPIAPKGPLEEGTIKLPHALAVPGHRWWLAGAGAATAVYLIGDKALNAALWLLPSVVSDWSYRLPLFDLAKFGGPTGPLVPYAVKLGLISLTSMAVYFLGIPLVSAYQSERVLGVQLPRGRQVGLRTTLRSGWTVFSTISLRLGARMMASFRDLLGRTTGQGEAIQAMRYGASPVAYYETHSAVSDDSSEIPARNLTQFQTRRDILKLTATHFALFRTVSRLAESQIQQGASALEGVPLDAFSLRAQLGNPRFEALEARFRLTLARTQTYLNGGRKEAEPDAGKLYSAYCEDPSIKNALSDPFAPLSETERKEVGKLERAATLEKLWPRVAGNNSLFFKFKKGVASKTNADVYAETYPWDNAPHLLLAGVSPGEFANAADPAMLVAANDSWVGGVLGERISMEEAFNVFGWIAAVTTDELSYGREEATSLDRSLRNPEFTEHGVVYNHLRHSNPAGFVQSLRSYLSILNPTHADFWQGIERLGVRITVDQIKTWKPLILVGSVTTFLGYLLSIRELKEENQNLSAISKLTAYKVILFNCFAYICYRVFWMWHSLGIRNMKSDVDDELKRYFGASNQAAMLALDSNSNRKEKDEILAQLEGFFAKHGKRFPPGLIETYRLTPDDPAPWTTIAQYTVNSPPMPTINHRFSGLATTNLMGLITTVIGTFGSGFAWKFAESFGLAAVGSMLAAAYFFGKGMVSAGGNMRGALSYGSQVAKTRLALQALTTKDSPENRQAVFDAVQQLETTYAHYGNGAHGAFADALKRTSTRLDTLTPEGDILNVGTRVYVAALENPPADVSSVRKAIAKENATDFCVQSLASNK